MTTYTSQYPPSQNSTYVKTTSDFGSAAYGYFATDPTKSLTGSYEYNSWLSNQPVLQNNLQIDLGSTFIIKRIYYENLHHYGDYVNGGAKDFTFWGSNTESAFTTTTYGVDTDWTELTTDISQLVEHVELDQADPQYVIVTNSTAYRYYRIKMSTTWGSTANQGLRRIELQTEDALLFTPKIIFF